MPIQRDITFMRDELGLPLVHDKFQHGYFYDRDVSDFPVCRTTTDELAALFLARQALDSVRGTALADVIQAAFAKLTRSMPDRIQFSRSSLDETFTRKVVE